MRSQEVIHLVPMSESRKNMDQNRTISLLIILETRLP